MIKRISHIVLSAILAVLLVFGTTAKEFIHLLADHTDTVDTHIPGGGLVLEKQHHHCTFLTYSLSTFVNDLSVVKIKPVVTTYPQYYRCVTDRLFAYSTLTTFLRGPPSLPLA